MMNPDGDSGDQDATKDQMASSNSKDAPMLKEEEEAWEFTSEDEILPKNTAEDVVNHVKKTLLHKRISEATDDLDIERFETSLARFSNSELILDEKIGSGNFSDIYTMQKFQPSQSFKGCTEQQFYQAEQIKENWKPNQIVIKLLRAKLLLNPALFATGVADLMTEGTILASLNHTNIVSIRGRSVASIEAFATGGRRDSLFILLERLHGNLRDCLKNWKARVSENGVMRRGLKGMHNFRIGLLLERILVMTQIASAMSYLHDRNIIHRDLSIANVGIDSAGRAKLFDFGLAKILPKPKTDRERFLLTANTGSLRYMAPEVGRGEQYNLKADVYSFSILLYEILNLNTVWMGMCQQDISQKVHCGKLRPMISIFWPKRARDILKNTWSDTVSARLSMKHVHIALERLSEELSAELVSRQNIQFANM